MILGVSIIVVGGIAAVLLLAMAVIGVWVSRPASEMDRRFDLVDQELAEEERIARDELYAARLAREVRIHGHLPAARVTIERDATVLDFPRRFRVVKDGLDEIGESAEGVFPLPPVDAGSMLTSDGLGGAA